MSVKIEKDPDMKRLSDLIEKGEAELRSRNSNVPTVISEPEKSSFDIHLERLAELKLKRPEEELTAGYWHKGVQQFLSTHQPNPIVKLENALAELEKVKSVSLPSPYPMHQSNELNGAMEQLNETYNSIHQSKNRMANMEDKGTRICRELNERLARKERDRVESLFFEGKRINRG
jgi:hypothetical protein